MTDKIGYGVLIETAMLGVVKGALKHIAEHGLEAEHHFYITFMTTAEGVSIPASQLEKHPQAMTIVLQNQFWNLKIDEEKFSIDLSFNRQQQTLTIPFSSIISFDDPSVQFSLHFNASIEHKEENNLVEVDDEETEYTTENVVSLADFRKKNKTDDK